MAKIKASLIGEFYKTLEPSPGKPEDKAKPHYSIKPSSLGTKCMRKLYYSSFRVPKDFDVNTNVKKMGAMGDAISHVISNKLRSQGVLIDYVKPDGTYNLGYDGEPNLEFPIESEALLVKKGYIDGVVVLDGELWLTENKTATFSSFSRLQGPKPDHMIQGVLYLHVFNKMLADGHFDHIERLKGFERAVGIRFLYVDRDNAVDFPMKEFPIAINQSFDTMRTIAQKVSDFKGYGDTKTLPPKTSEWCNNCEWRTKCGTDQNI